MLRLKDCTSVRETSLCFHCRTNEDLNIALEKDVCTAQGSGIH